MVNLFSFSSNRFFDWDGMRFRIISFGEELHNIEKDVFDAILVESQDTRTAEILIRQIRSSQINSLSIYPIIYVGTAKLSKLSISNIDGQISSNEELYKLGNLKSMKKKLDKIRFQDLNQSKDNLALKVLSFLYSRESTLEVVRSRDTHGGFSYPVINCSNNNFDRSVEVLSNLTSQGFLNKQKVEETHVCKSCSGNYLNFTEVCPSCNHVDKEYQEMIHHFRCAYVGPESDFKDKNGNLNCPKCQKDLLHIGVDYDRPGHLNTCNSCGTDHTNSKMLATCFDCDTVNELHELELKEIYAYSLTDYAKSNIETFKWDGIPNPAIAAQASSVKRNQFLEDYEFFKENFSETEMYTLEIRVNASKLTKKTGVLQSRLIGEINEMLRFQFDSSTRFLINSPYKIILFTRDSKDDFQVKIKRFSNSLKVLFLENLGLNVDLIQRVSKDEETVRKTIFQNSKQI
jgi:hypothetical protein